jgi:uncharacterized protein with HEPN domain
MRDDRQRLLDILEAIEKIEKYINGENDFASLSESDLYQVWVTHHLQIIGEAASKLSEEFRKQHPEVSWGGMIGMRHVLVHGYFETDLDAVWSAVENDLPRLKKQIKAILA